MRLTAKYLSAFAKDVKRLRKKHVNLKPLCEVIELVMRNDEESLEMLRSRHNMHLPSGNWAGHKECHVANAGEWLLIWTTDKSFAYFERTGTHDELFR